MVNRFTDIPINHSLFKEKALATSTAAIHQNINSRDTAVLLRMLSLLSYKIRQCRIGTIVIYSYGRKLNACVEILVYSCAATMPFYAKPNQNLTLIQSQTFPQVLHGQSHYQGREATFVMAEMQVAAHAQTQCCIFRLQDYKYGCRTCRQLVKKNLQPVQISPYWYFCNMLSPL